MIDLNHLEQYRENNRIEAKKALGGLPQSIWETYSAFANTLGGIILLGVEEHSDKSLHAVNLPVPEKLVKEFWDAVNNPNKASVNVLTSRDVRIETVDGNHIIVITVPRAQRFDRPVYVDGNLLSGTYRRNGEGDYHCSREEVQAMLRDAAIKTQDMLVLEEMEPAVLNAESIRSYRQRMSISRPDHVWGELDDEAFLLKLGALSRGKDGKYHPTGAGLLMFGEEPDIVREYPYYFLDYRDQSDSDTRWVDRFVSSTGDWSGNVYDFYYRVYNKLALDIKVPFKLEGAHRVDDTPVHKAIREALANCIINADYYGPRGLVIVKERDKISMSNPGGFRLDVDEARSGGVSDPRNGTLMKMFTLLDIGERAGSGIPSILHVWAEQGWPEPQIKVDFVPERTTLILPIGDNADIRRQIGDKSAITIDKSKLIIGYLTDHPTATAAELAQMLRLKPSRTRDYLKKLIQEDIVVAEGANRNRSYKLKS